MKHNRVIRKTPAVTAGAYTAGWCLGAAQQLDGVGSYGDAGQLMAISIVDRGNQKPAITFLVFEGDLTGTYADAGAPAPSAADLLVFIGKIDVATADYVTINGKAYATKAPGWLPLRSKIDNAIATKADRRITIVPVATGTPTPASVGDYTFSYGVEHSN